MRGSFLVILCWAIPVALTLSPNDVSPRGKIPYTDSVCQPNEGFESCATPCPAICGEPSSRPCPGKCVKTCVCKKGFILSSRGGTCIRLEACKTNPLVVD